MILRILFFFDFKEMEQSKCVVHVGEDAEKASYEIKILKQIKKDIKKKFKTNTIQPN